MNHSRFLPALIEAVDAAMPGRRIGSEPPEDCTAAAKALVAACGETLPDPRRTPLLAWLAANGQRTDERFMMAFHRSIIREEMRRAVGRGEVPGVSLIGGAS